MTSLEAELEHERSTSHARIAELEGECARLRGDLAAVSEGLAAAHEQLRAQNHANPEKQTIGREI